MSTKIKETIPCGCCGHEIPRPSFFKRGYTITCPACKTKGWMRSRSRCTVILSMCMYLVPALVGVTFSILSDDFSPLEFGATMLILGLPFLLLHQYYYEAEYMWPKDTVRKGPSANDNNQNNNEK